MRLSTKNMVKGKGSQVKGKIKVVLAIGIFVASGVSLRAQSVTLQAPGISFTFGASDREIMREWYRTHNDAPEFRGDTRWEYRLEQRLQVGTRLDPDFQPWVRPLPADLAARLSHLPKGLRYQVIGHQHVIVVDNDGVIREVYHFERFQDPDQQVVRRWYPSHRETPPFVESRSRWNLQMQQRIVEGAVLDADLLAMSRPIPPDLLDQLPPRPRWLRYVIIGDNIVLLDRWNTVRDALHLEPQPGGPAVPVQN